MDKILHPAVTKTKLWLEQVIIGLNFCPFAKKEFVNETIHYHICPDTRLELALNNFIEQLAYLEKNSTIETTLFICSLGFRDFEKYLDLVDYSNELLIESGYEGIFQIASFHPNYVFEGEDEEDASNYTNRSPLPILHIIREESMARVLSVYDKPELIPEININLARDKVKAIFKIF